MPSNYSGNPSAAQPPSPVPNSDDVPILALPNDGEDLNVSSVIQAFKTLADWIAWIITLVIHVKGVRRYSNTWTYTTGDLVEDPFDYLTYKSLNVQTGVTPHGNPSSWKLWGHDEDAVRATTVLVTETSGFGVTATNGASVGEVILASYNNGAIKRIDLVVDNVPGGATVVDLNGSAIKFANSVRGGTASMLSGGGSYGGQVGLNLAYSGDKNKVLVWYKIAPGDPSISAKVGVSLVGY
jgi:hypothetical protein